MNQHFACTGSFLLPGIQGTERIHFRDIIRIEAISNYSKLYLTGGRYMVVARVLRWFEERLAAEGFIRTHRTHLVNSCWILEFSGGGKEIIRLQNGDCLQLSRRKRSFFLKNWPLRPAA